MTNNIYSPYRRAHKYNIEHYTEQREPKPANMKQTRRSKPQPPRTAGGKPDTRGRIRAAARGDRPP